MGGCVVRISEWRMWGQQIDEHGEYFVTIEWISKSSEFSFCVYV
jgi:hypothetical protein